jgi:cephalosporin hydroxylase
LYSAYAKCKHTTFIIGDSIDPTVMTRIRPLVADKRVMVSLDSAHDAMHVAREINAYAPLVTSGCYLVVEDGIFDLAPTDKGKAEGGAAIPEVGGPLRAIESILVNSPYWRRDTDIERVSPLSYYPAGWWIRT